MRILFLLIASLGLAANAQPLAVPCGDKDTACAREAMMKHPVRSPEFWKARLALPLSERIGPAPPELVQFVTLDNVANGYPNRPRASKLEPAFLADVRRAFDEMPGAVKRHLEEKLAGIYFADDFGGTGYTDEIGEPGKARIGFVILDPSVLATRKANAWATWKERSPFKPAEGWDLSASIEEGANDTYANAIQYILLHELGHVLSIGASIHPSWAIEPKSVKSTSEFAFFGLSWTLADGKYISRFDATFPQRKDVVFYFGPKLEASAMPATYAALASTNFPTLYAATHPGDDFAESFANYVHVVLMGKPFSIRITHEGRLARSYSACWNEPRCAQKRSFMENFLR